MKFQELASISGYINTDAITISELIGKKIVLVDFWTYSCINCQRTLPYLISWHEKYKDRGLEIIGVHTPEFEFEKKKENVERAVKHFGITYPVVLDNQHATWHAYDNRYWPRKYLIDKKGFIVYDHIGEGAYEETERKIQELLGIQDDITKPDNVEDVDRTKPRSPEIYFGAERNTYLGNGQSGVRGEQSFVEPEGIKTNILYFSGKWNIQNEYAKNVSIPAKIIFRYRAAKVFMVASAENDVEVQILVEGDPVSTIAVKDDQLYRLIEGEYGEHTLEIVPQSPGLRVFTFTFG